MPDQDGALTPEILGQRLRDAIRDSGIAQKDIAVRAGMDPTALSKALSGQRNLSSLELALICDALCMSPLSVLGGAWAPRKDGGIAAADRVRFLVELDALLAEAGLPARTEKWPFTLLDRAIEAYVRGDISIRPIAGILGTDADDLLASLPRSLPHSAGAQ